MMSDHRALRRIIWRRGFALLAVLWVIIGIAGLGVAASLVARRAVASAGNRIALVRAAWRAEDCLERARAAIAEALVEERGLRTDKPSWRVLDEVVARSPLVPRSAYCELSLYPVGSRLDLNAADAETLDQLFAFVGVPAARADSLRDAILDWRDPDDVSRPFGAEHAWYEAQGRFLPRNGPFADVLELSRVRGNDALAGHDTLLSVEPGRIVVDLASFAVLVTLPGIKEEALAHLAERRVRGAAFEDLLSLTAELSPAARDSILVHYPELVGRVAAEPDAWVLTSRGRAGNPEVGAIIELRLVRAGARAAIVRRRTWN